MPRPPLPPFTAQTAAEKVRLAENAWNGRDPEKVALAYTPNSIWRNRVEQFIVRQLRSVLVDFARRHDE